MNKKEINKDKEDLLIKLEDDDKPNNIEKEQIRQYLKQHIAELVKDLEKKRKLLEYVEEDIAKIIVNDHGNNL